MFTLRTLLPFPVFGVRKVVRNERLNQRATRGFAPSFSRADGFVFGVRKVVRNERLNQRATRGFAPSFSRADGFAFGRS